MPLNISIGIAAYNAEKNIEKIIQSLLTQKVNNGVISEIIIHSDCSSDKTVSIVQNMSDNRIQIIDNKERKGFAGSLETILNISHGDILITLNDDIKITDDTLVQKLVTPFLKEKNVGLVCGRPYPLPPINFIEGAIFSTYKAYDQMRFRLENKNSEFTCDGKILVFSRNFLENLKLPADRKELGNVDAFMYFYCITHGFKYRYVKDALVYYRNPTTIADYVKWTSRNNSQKEILRKNFGSIVDKEFYMPQKLFLYYSAKEFIKNPFGATFIVVMRFYLKFKSRAISKNFDSTWETIETTKNLD